MPPGSVMEREGREWQDLRPNITFSQDAFPIAFGISGEGSDYIDAKGLFTLSAEILYNDNTDVEFEMISTPLPVRHCYQKSKLPYLTLYQRKCVH